MSNERIEAMKREIAARRAAANAAAGKVAEQGVTVAERIGRGLARTKNAVVGSITGISDTIDAIGTSYTFYSEEMHVAPVSAPVIAAKKGGRSAARA